MMPRMGIPPERPERNSERARDLVRLLGGQVVDAGAVSDLLVQGYVTKQEQWVLLPHTVWMRVLAVGFDLTDSGREFLIKHRPGWIAEVDTLRHGFAQYLDGGG